MTTSTAWLDRYLDVLSSSLGLDAAAAEDGSRIRVNYNGLIVILNNTGPADPAYLHAWTVFADEELKRLPRDLMTTFAADSTVELKMVKVMALDDGAVALSVEAPVAGHGLLPSAEHLCAVLPRILDALFGGGAEICKLLERQQVNRELAGIEAATLAAAEEARPD